MTATAASSPTRAATLIDEVALGPSFDWSDPSERSDASQGCFLSVIIQPKERTRSRALICTGRLPRGAPRTSESACGPALRSDSRSKELIFGNLKALHFSKDRKSDGCRELERFHEIFLK